MAQLLPDEIDELRGLGMTIGDDCRIIGEIDRGQPSWIHLGHRVLLGGKSRILVEDPLLSFVEDPRIVVGGHTWIGRECTLLPGCRIRRGSFVGAMSVLDGEYPPYHIIAGNRARAIRPATALELLRYYNCMFVDLRRGLGSTRIDWSWLTPELMMHVLGIPRDVLFEGDPAAPLIEHGWDGLSVDDMFEVLGIDDAARCAGVTDP